MLKHILFALGGYLITLSAYAQSTQINEVLTEIEQNNKELKAFQSLIESEKLNLKAENNLPELQISGFYLPFGDHDTGDYTEYQVSQSFQLPAVYKARNELIGSQTGQLKLEYEQRRQEILMDAKNYCLELIAFAKRQRIEENRRIQAKEVLELVQERFEKEEIEVLELNKAKIAWLQDQFKGEEILGQIRSIMQELQKLNGGKRVEFGQLEFTDELAIASSDSIWLEIKSIDPQIKAIEESAGVARQEVQLEKNKLLPEITAGFNYQGVFGSNYYGFYGGVSVPIWNNKTKINAAKANFEYKQSNSEALIDQHYTNFLNQYNQYDLMLRTYKEYINTLEGLNNEDLLLEDFKKGEISFLDYHGELEFFEHAYDKMLEMEKELYQLKTELLKHRL